ncbi:MAG TPA: polysaccharide biosynthesis C-terminal domain-containing protein [Pseudomonadota bacterium]|nr:polysaccharide biosynthesis C-terminal domain-containing protein [Pseudomonadota bacterium]
MTRDTPQPASTPSLLRSVVSTLATRFAILPLGLIQGALTARALGPDGLGRYSAVLVDVNIVTTLLGLGLPGGLAVLTGESQGQPHAVRDLWWKGIRHVLLALCLASLVGIALARLLPSQFFRFLTDRTPLVTALLILCVVGQLGRDIHNALLWGSQRFASQNRLSLALSVFQLASVAGLFLWKKLALETALGLQALSLWGLCVAFLLRVFFDSQNKAESFQKTPEHSDVPSTKRLYGTSLRNFFHILPDMLLLRIDVYLIELFLPPLAMRHQLGLYQAGARVAELILMLPGTLNAVLFAKAAAKEDIGEQALLSAKLGLYLGLGSCVAMFFVGKPLLLLFYGDRFAGSFLPCLLLLLGCSALCFSGPLAGALSGARGYPPSVIWAQTLALLTNVALNLLLLPRYGIIGAAWASVAAYTVSALCISIAFARHFALPLRSLIAWVPPHTIYHRLARR